MNNMKIISLMKIIGTFFVLSLLSISLWAYRGRGMGNMGEGMHYGPGSNYGGGPGMYNQSKFSNDKEYENYVKDVDEAITSKNYKKWRSLISQYYPNSRILDIVNDQKKFNKYAEAHKKEKEISSIYEDLGIISKSDSSYRKGFLRNGHMMMSRPYCYKR